MKLYVLSLGEIFLDKGAMLTPGVDEGVRVKVPVPGYLIQTDDGKNIVVDTGLHPDHIRDPDTTFRGREVTKLMVPFMRDEDTIEHRLGEIGVGIGDIDFLINTHLHFDHCGGNHAFAGIPIIVQRNHYTYARESDNYPGRYFDLPSLTYELIDGEPALFEGVEVVLTPGHAPWHQSLLIRLHDDANVLICADAIDCQDNLSHDTWGAQQDPELAKKSAQKLLRIADHEHAQLFYGHDVHQWRELRLAPAYYS